MPTVFFPGIVAIRADSELVLRAISSAKLIIFETFIPGAGSNSFKLTTGPWLIFIILPSTPKSKKIFSKKSLSILSSFELFFLSALVGNFKKSIDGSLNFTLAVFSLLVKGKSSCTGLLKIGDKF